MHWLAISGFGEPRSRCRAGRLAGSIGNSNTARESVKIFLCSRRIRHCNRSDGPAGIRRVVSVVMPFRYTGGRRRSSEQFHQIDICSKVDGIDDGVSEMRVPCALNTPNGQITQWKFNGVKIVENNWIIVFVYFLFRSILSLAATKFEQTTCQNVLVDDATATGVCTVTASAENAN